MTDLQVYSGLAVGMIICAILGSTNWVLVFGFLLVSATTSKE